MTDSDDYALEMRLRRQEFNALALERWETMLWCQHTYGPWIDVEVNGCAPGGWRWRMTSVERACSRCEWTETQPGSKRVFDAENGEQVTENPYPNGLPL